MTVLYLFLLHFYVIFNLKNDFFRLTLTLNRKIYSPQQICEKTRYYMILCDFVRKIVKFSFFDGGHLAAILNLLNRRGLGLIFLGLRPELYLIC